ncbi:MAG: hypothetical protein ACH34X_19355 [Thiolinea sp.]
MKRIRRVLSYLITLTFYLFLPSVYAQTAPNSSQDSCTAFSEQIKIFKDKLKNENVTQYESHIKILEQIRTPQSYNEADWLNKAIACAKARGTISNHPSTTIDWLVVDFLLKSLEQERKSETVKALNTYRYWRDPYFITEKKHLFIGQTGKRIRQALIKDSDEIIPIPSNNRLAVKIEESNNEIKPAELIKIKDSNGVLKHDGVSKKCMLTIDEKSLILSKDSGFLAIENNEYLINADKPEECFNALKKKQGQDFKWLYFNDVSGLCRDINDELNYYFIGGNDESLDYKNWESWFRQSKYEWREVLDSIITSCNPDQEKAND